MGHKCSLPCSQEPTNGPYPDPDEPSPHINISFHILPPCDTSGKCLASDSELKVHTLCQYLIFSAATEFNVGVRIACR
jgi:hypothetical protein